MKPEGVRIKEIEKDCPPVFRYIKACCIKENGDKYFDRHYNRNEQFAEFIMWEDHLPGPKGWYPVWCGDYEIVLAYIKEKRPEFL